jgi:uncharacterized membrane protein YfcA
VNSWRRIPILLILVFVLSVPLFAESEGAPTGLIQADLQWWVWALLLFGFTLVLGIVAVIGGVGGGVLFVPIVSAVFPFHFDFVRGAGLMVALSGALSAGPRLLRSGLANLRLGLPFALVGSVGSLAGAMIGLALPTETIQGMLGIAVVGIVILMLISKQSEIPSGHRQDPLSSWLGIGGTFVDENSGQQVNWRIHRSPLGFLAFVGIGILAGMFGVGAGWANVPAFNLLLGAPLKVAVATSGINLALNGTAAAWVYINQGAVLPLIAVPSIAGMMIGTRIGAQILPRVKAGVVRWIVIVILLVSGLRSLFAGFLSL